MWQPRGTLPSDGRIIIVQDQTLGVVCAKLFDGTWCIDLHSGPNPERTNVCHKIFQWQDLPSCISDESRALENLGRHFGVTKSGARTLLLLSDGKIKPRHVVGNDLNLASVRIHNLKKRLAPFGLTIGSKHGYGYFLEGQSLAAVQAAIKQNVG